MRGLVVVLIAIGALATSATAAAVSCTAFFSGKLMNYRNPTCYYPITEDCTNWNYWHHSEMDIDYLASGGQTLQSFENVTIIRGEVREQCCRTWSLAPGDKAMGGHLKASVVYWAGFDNYVGANKCI